MSALDKIFLAADGMEKQELFDFLRSTQGRIKKVKVGMEMFYRCGKELIYELKKEFSCSIFLDLKLHDIPNTLKSAIKSLSDLNVDFLTVHLSAGEKALEACLESTSHYMPKTKILGVSYLTSLGETDFKNIWNVTGQKEKEDHFARIYRLAFKQKISGVVLSAQELPLIKAIEASEGMPMIKVCPGIRFSDELIKGDDQQRTLDPSTAFKNGADLLVMGRSLTIAKNLGKRLDEIELLNK